MKTLELNQMEELQGGYCTKTATKVLMGAASAVVGAATGGIGLIFMAWAIYEMADTMTSETCENW
tara:strand:- start:3775 stop:3969 length:195 start_codon:yes stop_codon:yes gene_type:complete